jgi:hypothetical protein
MQKEKHVLALALWTASLWGCSATEHKPQAEVDHITNIVTPTLVLPTPTLESVAITPTPESQFITLEEFRQQIEDGSDFVRGVYIKDKLALPVIQQPGRHWLIGRHKRGGTTVPQHFV